MGHLLVAIGKYDKLSLTKKAKDPEDVTSLLNTHFIKTFGTFQML
jgi:hypothetical protein